MVLTWQGRETSIALNEYRRGYALLAPGQGESILGNSTVKIGNPDLNLWVLGLVVLNL